jgi:hypothetical protein
MDSLKSVLPEYGPVRLKHVAPNMECIYILMILNILTNILVS